MGEFPPLFPNDRETPSAAELMLGAGAGSKAVPRRLRRRALPLEHFRAA